VNSPKFDLWMFCELRLYGVLRSSAIGKACKGRMFSDKYGLRTRVECRWWASIVSSGCPRRCPRALILTLLLVARFLSTLGLVLPGLGPLLLIPFLPCGRLPLLRIAFGLLVFLAGYGTCGFILPLSSIGAP
jgi:hypothetical protein